MNNTTSSRLMDTVSLVFSVVIMAMAGLWLTQNGIFNTDVFNSDKLSWYLIRATGITAYILLTLSVLWGLALSTSAVRNWSPGPLTMMLHSTISWLGLAFGLTHGLLLMVDQYFTYRLSDVLIPFTGPYRPLAAGLGTLTLWVMLVVTPSFAFKKRLFSHRAWKTLHYTSYAAFLMATAHGLTAGTDATNLGFRLLFGASVALSMILLGYRIRSKRGHAARHKTSLTESRRVVHASSE